MALFTGTIQLRVTRIVRETADVATFFLEPVDGGAIPYEAGQFLTFILRTRGHEVRRSYSLCSAPSVDKFLAITVKRVDNGEVSRYWTDLVKTGDLVEALPPAGRFTLAEEESIPGEVVLIGGGSGIVPLFSLLKEVLTASPHTRVLLLLANRSEQDIIFYSQLREWEKNYPHRLRIVYMLSQASESWEGLRGRLNNARLENLVKLYVSRDFAPVRFFLCGPSGLMRTVAITLKFLGVRQEQIRRESFVIEKPPQPRIHVHPHDIVLRVKGEDHRLHVPGSSTILDASLAAGIPVPYSCRGGKCSSCAAICRRGKVHMTVNEVLTDRELEQGWILTCTSYVEDSEVVVEIP